MSESVNESNAPDPRGVKVWIGEDIAVYSVVVRLTPTMSADTHVAHAAVEVITPGVAARRIDGFVARMGPDEDTGPEAFLAYLFDCFDAAIVNAVPKTHDGKGTPWSDYLDEVAARKAVEARMADLAEQAQQRIDVDKPKKGKKGK